MEERKIIIGKNGNQPFPITATGVSGQHASLTIDSNGTLILEDLDSTNGTYIRNENFQFERIARKVITRDTVIRFGSDDTIRSLTVIANQLIKINPDDFSYEFKMLRTKWGDVMKRKEKIEHNTSILSFAPPFLSVVAILLTINSNDPMLLRGALLAPSLLSPLVHRYGKKKLTRLNDEIKNTFVCPNPKCGRQLTEREITRGQCMVCKAKI